MEKIHVEPLIIEPQPTNDGGFQNTFGCEANMSEFACLGITAATLCKYDPSAPANVYFSIGDAVAALALTIAVQSYLKPAYRFRLAARGIKLIYIFGLCFGGFISVSISTLLPSIPIERNFITAYPVIWEIFGGFLFSVAYGVLAFGAVAPIKLRKGNHEKFARSLANFLSEQKISEYPEISDEILINLPELIRKSSFNETDWKKRSAFFEFIHRDEIRESSYASTLLEILSDSAVCKTLVESSPWRLASTFNEISSRHLYSRRAEKFVQQIAFQSIFASSSVMRREVGYEGFASIKIFSESLFASSFICRSYRPFSMFRFPEGFDKESYHCLGLAIELMISSTIKDGRHWEAHHIYDLEDVVRDLFWQEARESQSGIERSGHLYHFTAAIDHAITGCREFLMQSGSYELFFTDNVGGQGYNYGDRHIVHAIAAIVYQYFESVTNGFNGWSDPNWSSVHSLWSSCFPEFGETPDGVDPLQQNLAVMINRGLKTNINGFYPAISRIILSVIGPYHSNHIVKKKSAAGLMKRSFYNEFRKFKFVRESHYLKKENLLPDSVEYDEASNTLNFIHPSGDVSVPLSRIRPAIVDWVSPGIRSVQPERGN